MAIVKDIQICSYTKFSQFGKFHQDIKSGLLDIDLLNKMNLNKFDHIE